MVLGIRDKSSSVLVTITPRDPLRECMLPSMSALSSVHLEVLVPKGGISTKGHGKHSIELWLLMPLHFRLLESRDQQERRLLS